MELGSLSLAERGGANGFSQGTDKDNVDEFCW